jgi:hypothetical protein
MLWNGRKVAFYYSKEKEKPSPPCIPSRAYVGSSYLPKTRDMRLQFIKGSCACLWSGKFEQANLRSCSFIAHQNHGTNSTGRSSQRPPTPHFECDAPFFLFKYFSMMGLFSFVLERRRKGPKKTPRKFSKFLFQC